MADGRMGVYGRVPQYSECVPGAWWQHHRNEEIYDVLHDVARRNHKIDEMYKILHDVAAMTWDIRAMLMCPQMQPAPMPTLITPVPSPVVTPYPTPTCPPMMPAYPPATPGFPPVTPGLG
ncbi:MAG: hypothetical protein NUW23_13810 [Firmicutes bacterium]|jgi:hypothetical protein|nr:hypothetical protein [Bacillota bacterium]